MIFNITYSPSIIYSPGPETKLGIPTLISPPPLPLQRSFGTIPCNELRHLSRVLGELVSLEDGCQRERLDIILEGVPAQEPAEPVEGMLGERRSVETRDVFFFGGGVGGGVKYVNRENELV